MTGLEPAGFLTRLAAWIVDRLIVGSLWLLLCFWGLVVYLATARRPGDLLNLAALAGLFLVLGLAIHAAYFIVFVGGCGQTPGKMMAGIVVVRRDGASAGYGRATLRWVGYWLAVLPLGLGLLGVLFTAARRGLHDWLSGTRVVRRAEAAAPGCAFKEG